MIPSGSDFFLERQVTLESSVGVSIHWIFVVSFCFHMGVLCFHLRTYANGHPNGTQQPEDDTCGPTRFVEFMTAYRKKQYMCFYIYM